MTDTERTYISNRIDTVWSEYCSAWQEMVSGCVTILDDIFDIAGVKRIPINDDQCTWVRQRKTRKGEVIYEVKIPGENICGIDDIHPDLMIHILSSARAIAYANSNEE